MAIPEGFVEFGGHYYKYVKVLANYSEAQAGAAALGGHLATVTSAAENAFLASLIAGEDLGAWLGGSDVSDEGVWRWTEGPEAGTVFWNGLANGSAPAGQYTNWSAGEPNGIWNGIEEDHLHMMANSDKWNDASGYWSTMGYFVEIDGGVDSPGQPRADDHLERRRRDRGGQPRRERPGGDYRHRDRRGRRRAGLHHRRGADAALFSIDSETGVLAFVSAPDFEAPADADGNNVYSVEVQVSDGRGGIDTQALALTVADSTRRRTRRTRPAPSPSMATSIATSRGSTPSPRRRRGPPPSAATSPPSPRPRRTPSSPA